MPQAFVSYVPPREGAKSKITYQNAANDAADNDVKIVLGASVPLRRQTEIFAAIDMLANGIRDRNLFEGQFLNTKLVTAVNINRITAANRRTASDLALVNFAATDIGIAVGVNAAIQHRVMFDTAIANLKQRLLEEFKNQSAAAVVSSPAIISLAGGNTHTFEGMWPGGTVINVNLVLTDPDGQTESDVFGVTLPPGDHTSAVAASVVCAEIDALVHYRCVQTGDTLTVSAAAPANTIASALTV